MDNKLLEKYSHKMLSAQEAISKIKPGSRVFIGTAAGEPQKLIHTMVNDKNMFDIMIYQMLSFTLAGYINDENFFKRFSLKIFFVSYFLRKAASEGKIDYVPAYLSEIPKFFKNNHISLDFALVQVSPPDMFGFCSLGISVDVTMPAVKYAKIVIAQVNPNMPRTMGDSFISVDDIDFLVYHEEPLIPAVPSIPDQSVAHRIGFYVAQLVEDGSTLQIGFGRLPASILSALNNKKDLGIHTQILSDAIIPLIENGVITNRKKTFLQGKIVTSLCTGKKIYEYVDNNPFFYFRSSDFVNDPNIIARNDNFVSISSALEVDVTGQVCTDSMGYTFYSGIGDQADFIRGAAMSKGGFSIIALPSTAKNGQVSRIVSHLSEGAGVGTLRGDVKFVVTEYGIAELYGKSIYQRVMELAQIAHPKFRKCLIEEAKKHHYIFPDQLPPHQIDMLFIEKYKSDHNLKNSENMSVRPILPSDEFVYRNFFYSLKEETIYHRFYHKIKIFSHEMAQEHFATMDYKKNITIIGLVRKKGRKEAIGIASYTQDEENEKLAEVAFVVKDDYQGHGVATALLQSLEKIAIQNGYDGFSAYTFGDNQAMLKVFNKRYPHVESKIESGEMHILMKF